MVQQYYIAVVETRDRRYVSFCGSYSGDCDFFREIICGRGDIVLAERTGLSEQQARRLGRLNGGMPVIEHLLKSLKISCGEGAQSGLNALLDSDRQVK